MYRKLMRHAGFLGLALVLLLAACAPVDPAGGNTEPGSGASGEDQEPAVEDTETTEEELTTHFGPEISSIVMEVTDDQTQPHCRR